jgi:cyclic pyranopterin phosphate synthase
VTAEPKKGMVDVSGKAATHREAVAEAWLRADEETVRALAEDDAPKADPLPTARAAALLAIKRTPELIPHCHPIPITDAEVDFELGEDAVRVVCRVVTKAQTGVEMEALTGAAVAALTLYDMTKAVCPGAGIGPVRLLEKSGGQSGRWRRGEANA